MAVTRTKRGPDAPPVYERTKNSRSSRVLQITVSMFPGNIAVLQSIRRLCMYNIDSNEAFRAYAHTRSVSNNMTLSRDVDILNQTVYAIYGDVEWRIENCGAMLAALGHQAVA